MSTNGDQRALTSSIAQRPALASHSWAAVMTGSGKAAYCHRIIEDFVDVKLELMPRK